MSGNGRRMEDDARLLVVVCALGGVLSIFGALDIVVRRALELPPTIALAGHYLWSAPLTALAAWLGGYGAARFARRGWNPAFRPVEVVGVAAVAALLVELSGGYRLSAEAPLTALAAASLPIFQVLAAWAAAFWLDQILRPVTIDGRGNDLAVWADVYRGLRGRLLALTVATAGGWAAASLAVSGDPGTGGALSLLGGVLFVAAGLVLIARTHQRLIHLELRREGAQIQPGIEGGGIGFWLLILPAALALFIPANLSPFGIWNFNSWMERVTELLGPLLVPSQAPGRRIGEGLGRLSLDRVLADAASRGRIGSGSGGSFLLWAALLLALAFIARRIFHTPRRGERSRGMGRLPVGIGWLFEQIRAAIVRWLTRWGLLRRSTGQVRPAAIHAPHRRLRRPGQSERRSVTAIYVDVVGRMGRRGFSRRDSETPLEYLGRYRRSEIGAGGDAALTQLTDLYLAERYGERRSTKGILEQARRAAAGALRAFSRSKLASTVKSWVRGIGAKPHGGE